MKFNHKSFWGSLMLMALLFSACTKNTEDLPVPASEIAPETEVQNGEIIDLWLEQWEAPTEKIEVKQTSLAEVNALMMANGWEPFAEEFYAVANYRNNAPCSYFDAFGDWNGDSQIDILDVFGAQQFLCNTVGCAGDYDTSSEPFNNIKTFGYLSFLADGDGLNTLNRQDIQRLIDYILGRPVCF